MIHHGNRARRPAAMAVAILGAMPVLSHADVYVIVNSSSLAVRIEDIKAIYTGDKQLASGIKIKPLDNHVAQGEFLSKALQLNPNRYDAMWTMKSFRDGLAAPAAKASDSEVLSYVQATPGAIGYITSEPPAGVVVLKKY